MPICLNKETEHSIPKGFLLIYSVCVRKLCDDECPLYLRLCAGPSEKAMSLLLKENETGDVNVRTHRFFSPEIAQPGGEICLSLHSGMRLVFLSCATFWESWSVRRKNVCVRSCGAMPLQETWWSRPWQGLLLQLDLGWLTCSLHTKEKENGATEKWSWINLIVNKVAGWCKRVLVKGFCTGEAPS